MNKIQQTSLKGHSGKTDFSLFLLCYFLSLLNRTQAYIAMFLTDNSIMTQEKSYLLC